MPFPSRGSHHRSLRTLSASYENFVLVAFTVFVSKRLSIRDFDRPSEALGVNILGAVVGGIPENSVMIGGTQILALLALALYVLSAASRRSRVAAA